ncbi:carboxylate-amine ligase [Maribius pontilimi]|uniref:Putative glutamate--cysteine ligase 2 n=1 Tax=Palleronia pontilimi TaxID=1964209 RepID=A0A934IET0_9RHOB|nr:carboxylate-amine ligase [Palleronia pontilimi]MBJ3762130.1 carboxylate-amine ligase [Palleronia pontilimi]
MTDAPFTIGIEEEYLLVDADTLLLADAPDEMLDAASEALGDQVAPEFLRCQIEIGTKVCASIDEARADLTHLRKTVSDIAADFGLKPIAAACHPTADWAHQHHRDRERYNILKRDLAAVGRRMLICGMHVHVGIPDENDRIDLMNQAVYFLPHLLALSASSPFWQGRDTGLNSYRIGVFDNLPRTGMPPRLEGWSAYRRSVDTLIDTGLIEDGSKIWWDLRPSANFPTLETRICDVMPRLDHTLSVAATIQCIFRMLWRLKEKNQRWRIYDNFLLNENRWRAQRYGCDEGMIDFGRKTLVPMGQLVDELITILEEDALALGCADEVAGLRDILASGNSATRQRATYQSAIDAGAVEADALIEVVRMLTEEYLPKT